MKRKLRLLTHRNSGRSLAAIRDTLNPYLVGWLNYFALADAASHLERLDQWVRRRLRQILWKHWKTTANRYHNLRSLGVSDFWAKRLAGGSKSYWRISKSPPLHHALNNAYWRDFGLKSFLQYYILRHS